MKQIKNGPLWLRSVCALLITVSTQIVPNSALALTNDIVGPGQIIVPAELDDGRFFGFGLAASGNTLIAGGPNEAVSLQNTDFGQAYIFTFNGSNWVQQQTVTPTNVVHFGISASIDGDLAVVGARGAGFLPPGNAVVFARSGNIWFEQQHLIGSDTVVFDGFGESVAISGTTIAIGASSHTNAGIGTVYIFVQNGTNWVQQAEISPPDGFHFGLSVALDGDTLVAGSTTNAFFYVRNGGIWSLQQKVELPNGSAFELTSLPHTIALQGDTAVLLGYVYVRINDIWVFQQQLQPPGGGGSGYGLSASLRGNLIAITSTLGDSADLFVRAGTNWSFGQRLTLPVSTNVFSDGSFGAPVFVADQGVFVSAPNASVGRDQAAGVVVFYPFLTPVAPSTITVSPSVLFPPNHKFVPVTISVTGESNASCRIVSVSSSEPADKKHSPDWIITGDLSLLLRAERLGTDKRGRIYTIGIDCTDTSGNVSHSNLFVTVPHDKRK